jgi:hypothetical protein
VRLCCGRSTLELEEIDIDARTSTTTLIRGALDATEQGVTDPFIKCIAGGGGNETTSRGRLVFRSIGRFH